MGTFWKPARPQSWVLFLPLIGMLLFILCYLIAALVYPGGNWSDYQQPGFSIRNNYLCDLLDYKALNGEINPARHWSRAALWSLCIGLGTLWYYLPGLFTSKKYPVFLMWISGLLAFFSVVFLYSGTHDFTLRLTGVLGSIAFISCLINLMEARQYRLFCWGGAVLLLFLANYYSYETRVLVAYLPLLQKLTFLLGIGWFVSLNLLYIKSLGKGA